MPRYRTYGPRDDQEVEDQDLSIRGFRSRLQSTAIPDGVASYLGNMRCDRGTAQVRLGSKALATDIVLTNPPVILDFTMGPDLAVTSITRTGTTATVTTAAAHGFTSGNQVAIEHAAQSQYNGDFLITVTGATTFTYPVVGSPATPATGTITCNKGPIVFEDYNAVVRASCEYADTDQNEGIVIASTGEAFLYRYGQATVKLDYPINETLDAGDPADMLQFLGQVYIWRGSAKVPMQWDGDPTHAFVLVDQTAKTGTLIPMPKAEWGSYFTRRIILQYSNDEIILSNFDDANTYDTQYDELRIVPGAADWLIGVQPYQDFKVLILYRYSVHLLLLSDSDLSPQGITEITRELGCAARKTLRTCGDRILWLSDNGIVQLVMGLELNLTQAQLPLSQWIQDIIDRINWTAVEGAVARYWKNRYYLAVPLDDSTTNNTVLVYNFLNQEWESVDTYPGDFDVQNFCVIDYNGPKRLHAITTFGFVFLLEELEQDEFGNGSSIGSYVIPGTLNSRGYLCGTKGMKRFTGLQLELNAESEADAFTANFAAQNPDSVKALTSFQADEITDVSYRSRLRQRGVAGGLQIATTGGRPEFKSIGVNGFSTGRAPITRE